MRRHAATRMLLATLTLCALAAAPAFAGKPQVDYDRQYDFASKQSFVWGKGTPAGDINEKRIVHAVERNLQAVGLTEAQSADLEVRTHVHVDRVVQSKGSVGIGIGRSVGFGGIGVSTSKPMGTKVSEVGNLAIEIYDRESGDLVWQAVVSDTVDASGDKLEKIINNAVDKAFKQYPVKPKK